MPISARYTHTNIVAADWRRLVAFYGQVFGCQPAGPERDHHGPWIEPLTGVADAHVKGVHLLLPGYGDNGPTLEIFQYDQTVSAERPAINRPGLAHLAFEVDDVQLARQAVHDAGGKDYGEAVLIDIPGAGTLELIYVTDPEGNIVELQRWRK